MPRRAPEKRQRHWYSGKRKRHTQEAQAVADPKTKRILATNFSAGKMAGKVHDFKLWQESRLPLLPQAECLADSGYLGLAKSHPNCRIATDASALACALDRNRRKRFGLRFGLRFSLIAAPYNYEIAT